MNKDYDYDAWTILDALNQIKAILLEILKELKGDV